MESRGQKRSEVVDDLPADKRACSSLEFKPSSSNSSNQTQMTSTLESHEGDMDTSSSASASGRSEERESRDSTYGSCDSDELVERQQRRAYGDYGKFKRIISVLTKEVDPSLQLATLTELCEVLLLCSDSSLSSLTSDSLAPLLVKFVKHENNEIMLFAMRAIAYLCDVFPRSSGFLVRHDAVLALCGRLMVCEYEDVAEQCLQALEKISREQPLACLQSGAIMAVLNYMDFFFTNIKRLALSIVVNICKKLPSDSPAPYMEAVPILCNLLQYEDRQIVENVVICLIKIAEQVGHSSEMLDELCKHGLIHQATHLIGLNSQTTLSQPVYTGLIGILVKLSSGSVIAVQTLLELNISSILKDILCNYDISHGMPSPHTVDGQSNQVHEVLKLLNELLPSVARNQDVQQLSDEENILVGRPDLLQKFGMDILPTLIQMVNSGANLHVCYGCLSVINKLVHFSKSDILLELLKNTNISSFLAGIFTRKDHHVLLLALQIVEEVLLKIPDIFMTSFIKEGVFFAVDALLTSEKCSQPMFSVFNSAHLFDPSKKYAAAEELRCLCYAFSNDQSLTSETRSCKIEKDSVQNLAKHIGTKYFAAELHNSEKRLTTDVLQKLKIFSDALTDGVKTSIDDEETFSCILHQLIVELGERESSISTFEFVESGIVKSLVNYLSNGQYVREQMDLDHSIVKRFQGFAKLFLCSVGPFSEDLPLLVLIRKLQSALSSVENFPLVLNHMFKQKNSYATVPYPRSLSHPCLKVRFVRGEGVIGLDEYSESITTVDPFSSFAAIEGYLWPKVSPKRTEPVKSISGDIGPTKNSVLQISSDTDSIDSDGMTSQHEKALVLAEAILRQQHLANVHSVATAQELPFPSEADFNLKRLDTGNTSTSSSTFSSKECEVDRLHTASNNGGASVKLLFYLESRLLDQELSLYQAILQQKMEAEKEIVTGPKLWSELYIITYRRAEESNCRNPQECSCHSQKLSSPDKVGKYWHCFPFLSSVFVTQLASDLEKSSPTRDILFLLKSLEVMNKCAFHLMTREKMCAVAQGKSDFDDLVVAVPAITRSEFVSSKLTDKLEQQMRDPLAISIAGMPSWCNQLVASFPFLFSFEARCKYFQLAAFAPRQDPIRTSGPANERWTNTGSLPRKKVSVSRINILESASQMMNQLARHRVILEVEYKEEVGTGLGPTLEFYTLVSHEFQASGLGMWRGDYDSKTEGSGTVGSTFGLFPCPWPTLGTNGIQFSEVVKKFFLLGQVVAKALQDGRVLDLPFSKAFYKLILGQELSVYDIQSFDPEFARFLIEFQVLAQRKKNPAYVDELSYRGSRIEELSLDFSLPGYPDYIFASGSEHKMVNDTNLEEYISLIVDATLNTGIVKQVEAFKSGFNQVFLIKNLQIFSEEELERLLCGERDSWNLNELLDHIKFDHGYTASSPPIVNLLEIIGEFDHDQRRAFLQFVTGAPSLPLGGLAALNPKLTIVRKHCSKSIDVDLPSVMTCANYLKLPPYPSKEKMKEKLLYAITEGQGSFHLS